MVAPTMDKLPRVPDTHGDAVNERIFSDLYIRTTWVDADVALDQITKGKARGRRTAIWWRSIFQSKLQTLGYSVMQKHAGKVLFLAILVLSSFCVGLKSAKIHSKVHQLWIQEGGRLEHELMYTERSLGEKEATTHQLLIQTARDPDTDVLTTDSMIAHLEVLRQASGVTVQMFDQTWALRDICVTPPKPEFDILFIEGIFDKLIPCSIVTPLDCFWEGSKLLGPEMPPAIPNSPHKLQWTSLNPQTILEEMKPQYPTFPMFDIVEKYMERAGISTGYMEKPCLDPSDPYCPDTAPNKKSGLKPDVGAELTGGCTSYAANYMRWPEELMVGGAQRNRTGHLKQARALQTVIQLMTEREMFESLNGQYRENLVGWSPDKAAKVLNAWQKKFASEVVRIMRWQSFTETYDLFAFSTITLDDILGQFSKPRTINLAIAVAVTIAYAVMALIRYHNGVRGQTAVGIAGVLFIVLSTAAGLGCCAVLGVPFNAATFQVVPFLALGIGVGHIFTLTATYAESRHDEQIHDILKKAGPTILCASSTTISSFAIASLIPVPALKFFCWQAGIVTSFNVITALLVFPALISLDLRRRRSGRLDFFCCCLPPWDTTARGGNAAVGGSASGSHSNHLQSPAEQGLLRNLYADKDESRLSRWAYQMAPYLTTTTYKMFVMSFYCVMLPLCLFQATRLQDGLDLSDIVPKDTNEHKFLNAQTKLFGFYNMFAVTQDDFEYQNNQKLLHEYHAAFVQIPHVIKSLERGKLPEFWLGMFRDWLLNLQRSFDRDLAEGRITQERWFKNASSDAILAYKLLVQTGHSDNPIDKKLVRRGRLVNKDGIINSKAFYNYLTAWASNDVFSYSASQGKLRPEPKQWFHSPSDYDLNIPKSLPLIYTQLPFYLHGLTNTTEIKTLISSVRAVCEKFESRGLANYPSGIPFIFWEQYMDLRPTLYCIVGLSLVLALVSISMLLLSLWAAVLVVFNAVATLLQLLAVMTYLGINLSALSAVILVLSVGFSVAFTVHVSLGFVTSVGNKDRRLRLAMQTSLPPVVHSTSTTILAVIMLYISPFEFIVRHFFWLLFAVMIISFVNGMFLFPVLLSIIGPAAELVPLEHPDRISTPSPPSTRSKRCGSGSNMGGNTGHHNGSSSGNSGKTYVLNNRSVSSGSSGSRSKQPQHHHSKASLTTITEEPQSWKSSNASISGSMHGDFNALSNSGASVNSNSASSNNYNTGGSQYKNCNAYHNNYCGQQPRSQLHQQQHPSGAPQQQPHHYQQQQAQAPMPAPGPQAPHAPDASHHGMHHTEMKSIVVQPEVTVETTTNGNDQNSTKVTATANIRVELVTPGHHAHGSHPTYRFSSSS